MNWKALALGLNAATSMQYYTTNPFISGWCGMTAVFCGYLMFREWVERRSEHR